MHNLVLSGLHYVTPQPHR